MLFNEEKKLIALKFGSEKKLLTNTITHFMKMIKNPFNDVCSFEYMQISQSFSSILPACIPRCEIKG
jgi:hypothetical protein